MKTLSSVTENVVRNHLRAFLDQEGLDAILEHYAHDAKFLSESRTYRGKSEIREFFEGFIATLPPHAIRQFLLRSLRCEDNVAYITWSAGDELPLATDTFVVRDGKIVSQTFAMYAPTVSAPIS
ncbi:MAG TPA: nuclear transport factor 2 family protein [Steroidobacteraceae bacterium]|nr:nuclear transport factor 2 family protein [Steroidobacteraceae bacterium]